MSIEKHFKAKAIWFKDLERWNVAFFNTGQWHWPTETVKRVSQFTEPESITISISEAEERSIPIISKISFGGKLHLRSEQDYNNYKGRLFLVRENRIIFSKINARRGCIFYVPTNHQLFAVSGEYPILKIDEKVVIGRYVDLALRIGPAKKMLFGAASGMAKARTYLEDFQRVSIPLPPLETQQAIVDRWQKSKNEINDILIKANSIRSDIDHAVLRKLGFQPPKQRVPKKAFKVSFKNLLRWSVSYNQAAQNMTDLTQGKFPVVELGTLLDFVQYGTSEKANNDESGIPIIRMNNVVDGELNLSDLKYIKLSDIEKNRLILEDGDVLFNRTNSKALVGKCAVFHEEGEYVFASYLIRLKTVLNKLLPDYLGFIINGPIGRQQIDALSRQIIGQANINSQEICSLQIPLPPLGVQKKIVEFVAEKRAEIAKAHKDAEKKALKIEAEIEALILGTKNLEELD
jgi:type I restriction enzyme S subunit